MNRGLPAEVRVVDFGIRGLDLAYALQDGYETTILIDAFPHGQSAGTVSVVEPDVKEIAAAPDSFVEPHSMHPLNVLRMARAMNGSLNRVLLVGCEPAYLGGDEGYMGLSEPVEAAVDEAVNVTEALVKRILDAMQDSEELKSKRRADMALDLIESTANGNGSDKDTLYMLGGVAMVVFGAGLILSNPVHSPLHVPDGHWKPGASRDAGRGALLQTALHVTQSRQ